MKTGLQAVPLNHLIRHGWLEPEMRRTVNKKRMHAYAKAKREGALFPPPVIFLDHDGLYWVGDGFHRLLADKENGLTVVHVDIRSGSFEDAMIWNCEANKDECQGLPFSAGDKVYAATKLLKLSPDRSYREIATIVGCSETRVHAAARRLGLPPRQVHDKYVTDEAIIAAIKKSPRMTASQIAFKLNCGYARITDLAIRCGVSFKRGRPRNTDVSDQQIIAVWKQGLTYKRIAEILKLSHRTVIYRVKRISRSCPACGGTGRMLTTASPPASSPPASPESSPHASEPR